MNIVKLLLLFMMCLSVVACERIVTKTERYSNGNVSGIVNYKHKSDVRHGKFRYYYISGDHKQSGVFKNGKLDGPITFYYKNERVKRVSNYKNGIKDGDEIAYYERGGRVQWEKKYKDGELLSEKQYDKSGSLTLFKDYQK